MDATKLIIKGRKRTPLVSMVYGPHGVGKTTFGTQAPNPIFTTGEEIDEIESARFPKCETWDDFIKYSTMVRDGNLGYDTFVVDTMDSIESLLWKKILVDNNAKDMAVACGGFGKAYTLAQQMFMDYRNEFLVPIRDKNKMNILLLCHATKVKVENPLTLSSYDTYEMKLHKTKNGGAYTVFSEWVSVIGFANYEIYAVKDENRQNKFAIGEGKRVLHLTPKPSYDAKNRYDLPDTMEFNYKSLSDAVNAFYKKHENPDVIAVKNEIMTLIEKIPDMRLKQDTIINVNAVGNDIDRLLKAKEYIQGVI